MKDCNNMFEQNEKVYNNLSFNTLFLGFSNINPKVPFFIICNELLNSKNVLVEGIYNDHRL